MCCFFLCRARDRDGAREVRYSPVLGEAELITHNGRHVAENWHALAKQVD
jgi:hypothetical protein